MIGKSLSQNPRALKVATKKEISGKETSKTFSPSSKVS